MHELPIAESILDIALRHATSSSAKKVSEINLIIGQISSVVDDSVAFYWKIISQGTICEDANLNFTRLPAILLCLECGQTYGIESELSPCPQCGSVQIKIIQGEEFQLESIDIET